MNNSSFKKNRNKWDRQEDWAERFPAEDYEDMPILKKIGWGKPELKKMIRLGLTNGEITQRGECNISLYNVNSLLFLWKIRRVLEDAYLEGEADATGGVNFERVLFEYLLERHFERPVSVESLKILTDDH